MARSSTAARRYAEAAFEIATRDDALDGWAGGLELAGAVVSDPKAAAFVDSPAVPLEKRVAVLESALAGRAPEGVVRLAKLLAQRRATARLPAISAEYRRRLNRERGIVEALVTSAVPLTPDETEALRRKISQMTDRTVELRAEIDESLIGGLTVRIGDTLYDASVRGRLERLRERLVASAR
jgi:F-type H+-transporting ATPase subunit delta